jgi:dienelactone hydrolase
MKKINFRLPLWATLFLLFCQNTALPAQGYCANDTVFLTETHPVLYDDVVYKTAPAIDEWNFPVPEPIRLRVYYPSDLAPGTRRPLVVLVHGGYFIWGDYLDYDAAAKRYAELGFIAATVGYRRCKRVDCSLANIFSPCSVSWPYSFVPSAYVATADVNDAIRWLQARDAQYFIDNEKVIVGGHSAGGYTALNVAFMDQAEAQTLIPGVGTPGAGKYLGEPLDPVSGIRAVVPMSGAIFDLDWIEESEVVGEDIAVALVHGTHDGVVHYATEKAIPCCGTYQALVHGSCSVAQRVQDLGGDLLLLSGVGFGHDVSDPPFLAAINQQIPAFIIKKLLCGMGGVQHSTVARDQAVAVCTNGINVPAGALCPGLPTGPGLTVAAPEPAAPTRWAVPRVSPQPLSGEQLDVFIDLPQAGPGGFVVCDASGRVVAEGELYLAAGPQRLTLPFALGPGLYCLRLRTEEGAFPVVKVLKT